MNWITRLRRAHRAGKFTPADVRQAKKWATCAVGEAHDRYPNAVAVVFDPAEGDDPFPHDGTLLSLGLKFFRHVERDEITAATETYGAIQARVATLEVRR